ncbi:hypothetical protein ES703_121397 [subsurface metagenome]
MVAKRKLIKGTCKICGWACRRATSAELIKTVHAHYLKKHPLALSRKIKRGMKKARATGGVTVGNPLSFNWIGFAEKPTIEKITGRPYAEVREQVLDFFVRMLLGGVTAPKG